MGLLTSPSALACSLPLAEEGVRATRCDFARADWAADDDPAAAATTTITTRSLALAFSALAVCAAWWARAGPPYPALSHKANLAAAGPWALTLLSSRARSPLARVWLLGGAWAMVGFVVAHWLVMPDGVMVG